MNEATLTVRYQIRKMDYSDLDFVMRAQRACQFEMEQLDRDQIAYALWNGLFEGFILTGPQVRMSIVIQRQDAFAHLALFYREGLPVGLWTEAQMLWEKVVDYLQEQGVTHVAAFIHRDNPKRNKLLRFYKRLGFIPEMVRIGRGI